MKNELAIRRPFSLLVKPASADCNLRCRYCFYLDRSELYPERTVHRMSAAVLETMIRKFMALPMPRYAFGWQGGEPTLMGLDFFKRVTELQSRYGRSGAIVANGLQTNATLITPDMARHFSKYSFLLGVSLDGPPELHDPSRQRLTGGGSHADVMRGIDCLRGAHTDFNILALVSSANVAHASLVYRYLCDQGAFYHQYIPCVEFDAAGRPQSFAIDGVAWGEFLCALFDAWFAADTRRVSIRLFDSILAYLVDGARNICHMGRDCRQYFVVEYNGDVYPCDFFVVPDLRIGNITTMEWRDALESGTYREFGRRKSCLHSDCEICRYLGICQGDCLKHRQDGAHPVASDLSRLCLGWQRFFDHSLPRFRELAAVIRKERQAAMPPAPLVPEPAFDGGKSPGRNDPCPCGSGRKYKKCCLRA